MLSIAAIVAPVFGLIALGFIFGSRRWLSDTAENGVAEFAFNLAIPALLFKTIATANFENLPIGGVWLSFYGAVALGYVLAVTGTAFLLKRSQADAASIAMSSMFGNAVMLGIPISMTSLGATAAAGPLALILSTHAPTLWLVATLHARLSDRQAGVRLREVAETLFRDLARNPIIIAIACGALWRVGGLQLPEVALKMLALLAEAGVPAALVALGLSLTRFRIKGQVPTLALILTIKLVAMPLVAFGLGRFVFDLDPAALAVVAIVASAPTGANAYIFANRNGRAINSASGAVALGTVLSAVTMSVLLAVLAI